MLAHGVCTCNRARFTRNFLLGKRVLAHRSIALNRYYPEVRQAIVSNPKAGGKPTLLASRGS